MDVETCQGTLVPCKCAIHCPGSFNSIADALTHMVTDHKFAYKCPDMYVNKSLSLIEVPDDCFTFVCGC